MKLALCASVVCAMLSASVGAQSTYESSALRVKVGFWGDKLVAGRNDSTIAGLGMFPSSAPAAMMRPRSEEAADHYLSHRSRMNSGSLMLLAGTAVLVATVFVDDPRHDTDDLVTGMLIAGVALDIAAFVQYWRAREPLNRSIWLYNATLVVPRRPKTGP